VRINGVNFHFFVIPVSEHILSSMENLNLAREVSIIYKLKTYSSEYDFKDKNDRGMIIEILDYMCAYVKKRGIECPKRASGESSML
jgi:hypothetical protein